MAKQPAKGRKTASKSKVKPKPVDVPDVEVEKVDAVEAEIAEAATAKASEIVEPETAEIVPEVEVPEVEEPVIEEVTETPETPDAEPAPVAQPTRSSSIAPVLGGLLAGAIGFGAAYFILPKPDTTMPSQISAQSTEISGLREQIAAIPTVDLSAIEALQLQTADQMTAIDSRVTALETRLDDLSSRAGASGSISAAAYEAELDALRDEMENLRGTAIAELQAAKDQAASIEENAESAARAAAARAALARIQGGMETGAPLGEALDDLSAALQGEVPAELSAVRDGTPTLASLQAAFPDLARDALAVARSEGVSGEAEGGFTSFLRNQFDVRSVAPKEGNTTDAILSRAEANLRDGRLTDTLAEISALPEVARASLSEWIGLAEARADALAAAATLTTTLNAN